MDALVRMAHELSIDLGELPEPQDIGRDEHGDMSVAAEATENIMRLRENKGAVRVRVNHAIDLARQGLRGVCEDCSGKIPPARLEAVPYATRCVKCEAKQEGA